MSKLQSPVLGVGVLCALLLAGQPGAAEARQEPVAVKQTTGGQATDAVTLAMTAKVGDTVRYRTTIKLDIGTDQIVLELTSKQIIKEVKDNQDTVLRVESEKGYMTVGGMENELPAGAPTTVTANRFNQILDFKPEREDNPNLTPSTQHLMAFVSGVLFPDKPVKAGDSWTTEPDNPQVKDKKVTIKTTFVGLETFEGAPAWKVKQTLTADTELQGSKMTSEMTALLDPATGQIIDAKLSVKGMPGPQGAMDWTGTMARLKATKTEVEKTEKPAPAPATP